ncbi:MAG: hypothetical protein U0610_27235 [bacterium]
MNARVALRGALGEELGLLPHVVAYEWRKATAFAWISAGRDPARPAAARR